MSTMFPSEVFLPYRSSQIADDDLAGVGRDDLRTLRPSDSGAYGWLDARGLSPVEAANLVAFRHGLAPAPNGWTPLEVRALVLLSNRVASRTDRRL